MADEAEHDNGREWGGRQRSLPLVSLGSTSLTAGTAQQGKLRTRTGEVSKRIHLLEFAPVWMAAKDGRAKTHRILTSVGVFHEAF
jgi:hypothetical protein